MPKKTANPVVAVETDEAAAMPVKQTPTRQSSVPPKTKAAAKPSASITSEQIAERAYHLWKGGAPGGETDHWTAAERELRGE